MIILILGLMRFLGVHSVRIFAENWRRSIVARIGDGPWKGVYSVASIVGFVLIIWGYGVARQDPVLLWISPRWLRDVSILLNLIAFVLFAAYLVPAGWIKARLGHPMILSVKLWAFAHLLANGTLADLFLFGAFLIWAVADFSASRRRDRAAGIVRIAGSVRNDALAVVVGFVIWAAILWRVHEWVIGVSPLA
jgi:uncharacterized membrane protein